MSQVERHVHVTARTLDEARRRAATLLRVTVQDVRVEVLAARRSGLFGLGAPRLEVVGTTTVPEPAGAPEPASPPHADLTHTVPSTAAAGEDSEGRGWRVWCQDGGCFLEVDGPAATLEDVEDHVRPWPLDEYDREAVRLALRNQDRRPVRFARVVADGEGPVAVRLTEDRLWAWLIPVRPIAASMADLRAALAQAGVANGIDEAVLAAAAGHMLAEPLLAARGSEGTPSRDAAVEYLFSDEDDGTSLKPLVREDGSVDYRELQPIVTVAAGDVVGHYLPAVDGEPPRDVLGQPVGHVAAGRQTPPAEFAGAGVLLAENGIDFVASRAGRPWRNNARIEVAAVHTVAGDVDYSSGNVDFAGDVFVVGDVKPGFTVKASGSVRIDGMVDAGFVDCGRDLLVRGGIHGHGESKIVCGGSMSGRFIEAAELTADGDVLVVSTIVRSTVTAGGQVTVLGRGSIVGGKVKAVSGISCTAAGSAAGVATSLELDWLGALRPGIDRGRELARLKQARVVVYGDAFPGLTVNINGAKFPVRDQIRGVQFQGTDRGITLLPAG